MKPSSGASRRVWDAMVRLCHWALAVIVAFNLIRDDGSWLHRWGGYVATGLVLVRLTWGAFTSGHASLRALKPSVSDTLRYLRAKAPRTEGHDPLGVWMVWLLWLLVLALGVTGWIGQLDAFWGDERLQDLHAWLANALLVSVLVHLVGVLAMSWRWRENLPRAMVTGVKRASDADAGEGASPEKQV